MVLMDRLGRPHDYLRLSLTERCNLACAYCHPVGGEQIVPEELTWDEILFAARVLVERAGVRKIRLTGGEPLVRRDLSGGLSRLGALRRELGFELALTTNGVHLSSWLPALERAGIRSLNVSVDSLNAQRFKAITRVDALPGVLEAVRQAEEAGLKVRLNMVVLRDMNLDEVDGAAAWALESGRHLRFIEYMPFGSNGWRSGRLVPYGELLARLQANHRLEALAADPHAVSMDYASPGKPGRIGFIASMTRSFCGGCNRLRITGRGRFRPCLFSKPGEEVDLRPSLAARDADAFLAAIQGSLDLKSPGHESPQDLATRMTRPMQAIGG
ncbi:MAG: GTP 3',8-cyclase MoaA [Spirochaetes bacterium]|nr:GTP 3',8-cyclase MoaA [Spirochaetota bacterium]